MRWIVSLAMLVACTPTALERRAMDRLGASYRHLCLIGEDSIDGDRVYMYCRDDHRRPVGSFVPWQRARAWDGACVMYICGPGQFSGAC
jgi:hypothetical protein